MSAAERIGDARLIICVGAGGVGKTTTSAAIALLLAERGQRVALVTIDPARRLADALGIESLGNEPHRVVRDDAAGELWAMMLDPQATFDSLVESVSADSDVRQEILEHPIYRRLSSAVAGSQEFTAVAKLHELEQSGRFDAIVLDTPPSRNALDFLDAPEHLLAFIEGRGITSLIAPAGPLGRIAGRGSGLVAGTLGRLTGVELLRDIQSFLSAFSSVIDGFRERAHAVQALLADPATAFVIVTSAEPEPATEAAHFAKELSAAGHAICALVVNRVTPHRDDASATSLDELTSALGGDQSLATKVRRAAQAARAIGTAEAKQIERLSQTITADPILVPRLGGDLHDLEGLGALSSWLTLSDRARTKALRARAV